MKTPIFRVRKSRERYYVEYGTKVWWKNGIVWKPYIFYLGSATPFPFSSAAAAEMSLQRQVADQLAMNARY